MSKQVLILVEGQTEERFVKDTLAPAFYELDIYFSPTILVTKRVKDGTSFKGGVTNFAKFENDVNRLLSSQSSQYLTTLLDYYGLPNDFPGMRDRPSGAPRQRVQHVEAAVHAHFGNRPNFRPFFALHEFESWLFCAPETLAEVVVNPKVAASFAAIRNAVDSPEEINDRPEFAPSKRISNLVPGYRKTLHGPTAAARIGLSAIETQCPHFAEWLAFLRSW